MKFGRHCKVVTADDDVLLREGLASLLDRQGFMVVHRPTGVHPVRGPSPRLRCDRDGVV
jgi:hypothetical protein